MLIKVLVVRLVTMIGIVGAGILLAMWERARRREAVAAERQRVQENLELQRRTQDAELATVEERGPSPGRFTTVWPNRFTCSAYSLRPASIWTTAIPPG